MEGLGKHYTFEPTADAATLIRHQAVRWGVEVLFAEAKELLGFGLDQYQLMSATAFVRFCTMVFTISVFLEGERARLATTSAQHVTSGGAQRTHRVHLLNWVRRQIQHEEASLPLLVNRWRSSG
jgi:hypothetical protein